MFTQTTTQQVQWQNLKVQSEADIVLKIAQKNGWKDCKVFGHGDMITQPLESHGWKLIPADLYEYSIPASGVARILQIINAGVRIQGVIIADDMRQVNHSRIPAKPKGSFSLKQIDFSIIVKALLGIVIICSTLFIIACAICFAPLLILNEIFRPGSSGGMDYDYDPQLIVLVDDGNGETVWISVLTWFD